MNSVLTVLIALKLTSLLSRSYSEKIHNLLSYISTGIVNECGFRVSRPWGHQQALVSLPGPLGLSLSAPAPTPALGLSSCPREVQQGRAPALHSPALPGHGTRWAGPMSYPQGDAQGWGCPCALLLSGVVGHGTGPGGLVGSPHHHQCPRTRKLTAHVAPWCRIMW